MAWIKEEQVNDRLESLAGKGFSEENITPRIERAETYLKNELNIVFSVDIVKGWDTLCPKSIQDICSLLAAIFLKEDYFENYEYSEIEKRLFKQLDEIKKGKMDLLDDDGERISRESNKTQFSTTNLNPVFSMGNTGDDTYGDGSLDDYGINISGLENKTDEL